MDSDVGSFKRPRIWAVLERQSRPSIFEYGSWAEERVRGVLMRGFGRWKLSGKLLWDVHSVLRTF